MERLKLQLEKIILNYFNEKSVYGLDEDLNESKKLDNVKEVHEIDDEEVFFIYDDTLFGSAKDGMVFGEDTIYWREKFASPQKMTYGEIVESTANKKIKTNKIRIFNKETAIKEEKSIEVKDLYYDFISNLKAELIESIPRYESYYENAINSMETLFIELEKDENYNEIIKLISDYRGLILKEEDKSNKIRQISFKAYLYKRFFDKARKELDIIEAIDLEFYEEAKKMFKLEVKESEYELLEKERKDALAREDYEEAYFIFKEQKNLNIRDEAYLSQVEAEIKQAEYNTLDLKRLEALEEFDYEKAYFILNSQKEINIKTSQEIQELISSMKSHEFNSLNQERLVAMEKEEFNIAYLILKKQRQLNIKKETEIKEIKKSIDKAKAESLERYHYQLKVLVEGGLFTESKEVINNIYRIEPSYSLDREEILLMIYQYKLDEAKEAISKLSNLKLRSELEEIFRKNSKRIYEEIREAARNKDYNYFEFYSHLWNYKDEYSMSAIDYFALEGDSKGLLRALEKTDHAIMHVNIYGHDFLDLLGFACDSRFGNAGENFLDILKRIEYFVENKKIEKRIEFIKTGKEGSFYSYNISQELLEKIKEREILRIQELRLKELNDKLMSNRYFEKMEKTIRTSREDKNIDVEKQKDEILESFYREDLKAKISYPIKGEFERKKEFKNRCDNFLEEHLMEKENIEEYKKQNPEIIEEIAKSIELPNRYFIADLLSFLDYREESIESLKNLNTIRGFLELISLYFPVKEHFVEIGNYNYEKEKFFVLVRDEIQEISVPSEMAKEFKESFEDIEYTSHRLIEEKKILDRYIYNFQENEIKLTIKTRKNIEELDKLIRD